MYVFFIAVAREGGEKEVGYYRGWAPKWK